MGNTISDQDGEDENPFYAQGLNLESPDADSKMNLGTAAPNCQPKHTSINGSSSSEGHEVGLSENRRHTRSKDSDDNMINSNHKSRNGSSEDATGGSNNMGSSRHSNGSNQGETRISRRPRRTDSLESNNSNGKGSDVPTDPKKMSYIQMAKMGYQELVNAIIRPPRAEYKMEVLGPPAFTFADKRFTRTDFTLRTKRGYNLECSHWEPVERATDRIPVVIYMHGNSSARVEVLPQLSYLLSLGLAVFAFDFAGSGKSDGEYVSLGYYEREDLSCIVAHLRATNVVSTIALWGRSMGAATALMFGDRDPSIACMILDSPFADLTQLCEEMVEKGREQGILVPNILVSVALRMIQGSVKRQAGFNIKMISPISHSDKCFIPALFVAGEHDEFIKKHHSEQLYEKYAGDKNLIIVEGDHNSPRPKFMFDSASIFLQTCLQVPNHWALEIPLTMNLMCPPWYFEAFQLQKARRKKAKEVAISKQSQQLSELDNMGMTAERQRVIQASLFKMLGQADNIKEPEENVRESSNSNSETMDVVDEVDNTQNL